MTDVSFVAIDRDPTEEADSGIPFVTLQRRLGPFFLMPAGRGLTIGKLSFNATPGSALASFFEVMVTVPQGDGDNPAGDVVTEMKRLAARFWGPEGAQGVLAGPRPSGAAGMFARSCTSAFLSLVGPDGSLDDEGYILAVALLAHHVDAQTRRDAAWLLSRAGATAYVHLEPFSRAASSTGISVSARARMGSGSDITLELDTGATVVIGAPGSGKTLFAKALAAAASAQGLPTVSLAIGEDDAGAFVGDHAQYADALTASLMRVAPQGEGGAGCLVLDSLLPFSVHLPGGMIERGLPRAITGLLTAMSALAAEYRVALLAVFNPLSRVMSEDTVALFTSAIPTVHLQDVVVSTHLTDGESTQYMLATISGQYMPRRGNRGAASFLIRTRIS